MKTMILRTILRILLVILIIGLILLGLIFGLRYFNNQKYRPEDYDPATSAPFNDLSRYERDIQGVQLYHIQGDYLNGFHLVPDNKTSSGVIITFGGSEGSPAYNTAVSIAQGGYEVLSLFFFGMENQRPELTEVPLDFFDEVLAYIDETIEGDGPITVIGTSKGAELGLNLAARYPQIDNLVLFAPSAWSYMGLSYTDFSNFHPSWTWQGEEVPYIKTDQASFGAGINIALDFILNRPISFRPSYETSCQRAPNAEEARIRVEDSQANILIFAGADDMMWQSDISAQKIQEARPDKTEVHIYDEAGHIFYGDWYQYSEHGIFAMGGNSQANDQAGHDSIRILTERLEVWHQK